MKGKSFNHRLVFAWNGLRFAFKNEESFRTQFWAAAGVMVFMAWLNPPALWMALVIVMVALVFAAELFNTALEHLLDGLHPEPAEFVRIAKDCSAAAVLVFSIASVVVFVLMLVAVKGNH